MSNLDVKLKWIAAAILIILAAFIGFLIVNPTVWVESPYSVKGQGSAAVYMMIRNLSLREVCLIDAEIVSPPGLAATLHATVVEDGIARMKHVDKICLPPLGTFELRRGGYHVMAMGEVGDAGMLKVKLTFSDGTHIIVDAPVKGTISMNM